MPSQWGLTGLTDEDTTGPLLTTAYGPDIAGGFCSVGRGHSSGPEATGREVRGHMFI